jgi:hypothetical protein
MVIGTADKFPRFGRAFYESGPECGRQRLSAYFDRQVQAGRLAIEDTSLAAQHFMDLCASGLLRRLLFGVADATPDAQAIQRNVDAALRVFFAAYGVDGRSDQQPSRSAEAIRA